MFLDLFQNQNNFLIGGGGYPLEPYLMTPYRSAADRSPEATFNTKHAKVRNIIERTIGVVKTRFRCLLGARQLHYSPKNATKIVNVCVALHNVCVEYNSLIENFDTQINNNVTSTDNFESSESFENIEAVEIREQIKLSFL